MLRFLLKRRRSTTDLARLLVALDALAAEHRAWRPRRDGSLSLGPG
jgi:hypothetical protein